MRHGGKEEEEKEEDREEEKIVPVRVVKLHRHCVEEQNSLHRSRALEFVYVRVCVCVIERV